MTEAEQKIFDMQSLSYKEAMGQSEAERKLHRLSPLPKESQCLKEDGSIDLNVREITQKEYDDYQALRYRRGAAFEEARTAYLMKAASEGKIHPSLMSQIETNHVMPPDVVKERAEKGFLGLFSVTKIKEKFKDIMDSLFKPQHVDIMAEALRRTKEEG